MKKLKMMILIASIATATIFATGCPDRKSIADLEADPGRYQDRDVVIAGTVRDSYGISIPGTKYGGGAYKIDDGTGSIWILVSDGAVPSRGSQVGVKGRFSSGVSWKGRNYGMGIYEKDRRYGKR